MPGFREGPDLPRSAAVSKEKALNYLCEKIGTRKRTKPLWLVINSYLAPEDRHKDPTVAPHKVLDTKWQNTEQKAV